MDESLPPGLARVSLERLREDSILGNKISIFTLPQVAIPAPDDTFRRTFPQASFWAATRQRDFWTGRLLARLAIFEFTRRDPGWLGMNADGSPALPTGIMASLSHTEISGRSTAAVFAISASDTLRLGIDLEPVLSAPRFEKLRSRFEAEFSRLLRLPSYRFADPSDMTTAFTIYEAAVKILAQHGLGKAIPADFRSLSVRAKGPEIEWELSHIASNRILSGRTLSWKEMRLSYGIG